MMEGTRIIVQILKVSKKFLCITATSVPSERLFSAAVNLVAEKRSRLTSDNIDKLIFLYENKTT